MWLRRLLVPLFGLEERSAHTPDEVGWESLPEACVLQLHWTRKRGFVRTLERNGFQVLVLARHPLDVLVSILHFAVHEPETARWLDGAFGDERSIIGADPTSQAFRSYAISRRARALIDVSSQWWEHGRASIRYEDLVASPAAELRRIVDAVGVTPKLSPERVVEAVTFESLRNEAVNQHFWQGRPHHWRELIPAAIATEIGRRHSTVIRRLGYELQPDADLSHAAAVGRWNAKKRPAS
jgi:sulfotransferase family protein